MSSVTKTTFSYDLNHIYAAFHYLTLLFHLLMMKRHLFALQCNFHAFIPPIMKRLSVAAGANDKQTEQYNDYVFPLYANHLQLVPCLL